MNKQQQFLRTVEWRDPAALAARLRTLFALERLPRTIVAGALGLSLLAAAYWLVIASDLYVSEAHVIIQQTDLQTSEPSALGNLIGGGSSSADRLLLRDHLLSTDMLANLESKLHLRDHYSSWRRDPISRIWFSSMPLERFRNYFADRVTVDFDEYTRVLVIRAQAYDAQTAQAIAAAMVAEGEQHMNAMGHALAQEQVDFLERQVAALGKRSIEARRAMLDFQNVNGLASPESATETLETIVARLQAQLSDLQTQRGAMLGYLVSDSSSVKEIDLKIDAVRQQIDLEQKRLASPEGDTLNRKLEEYQRLELEAGFAQDMYKTALSALERGRIEATRTLKKVSVLQAPATPEYPIEPRRLYNSTVFLLLSLLMAGMLNLIVVIIRDHRD